LGVRDCPASWERGHPYRRDWRRESDQIVAALKKSGTPVWYIMAKDAGHGFQKKPNQDYQFCATVEFLVEYLLK
jgi:dipeptidyl aminopeptidase/acylaminoacyl peptidase